MNKKVNVLTRFLPLLIICLILCSCLVTYPPTSIEEVPEFTGAAFIEIDGNIPSFTEEELQKRGYEYYSELDHLGRCGMTFAVIGEETMPTEERGEIGQVKPSGWALAKYDFVDGKYLFNRCHLIGYQLSGENANVKNLITGTRYLNIEGMLPFENLVADYVKDTGNHVAYRVTPIFEGNNLVASGVIMEGYSIEDGGNGVSFKVYCYNVQPGVKINYANGENEADENAGLVQSADAKYILNTNSKKFHKKDCESVKSIKDENIGYGESRELLIQLGYSPCGSCKP